MSRDMKTKLKKIKIDQKKIIKNNRKIKAKGNITTALDHYPRNGQMEILIFNFIFLVNPDNE